jgi:hypothetical protein
LVFLFAENHRDWEMKQSNVLDACALASAGVLGCAGTEVPLDELGRQTEEFILARSAALFAEYTTDGAVLGYLRREQPPWYGTFQFGSALKVLRPSLPVRCVEDPGLREEMNPISNAYCRWELRQDQHPYPEYPNMGDHPINLQRERAMIDNLLALWSETTPALATAFNTGSAHSSRLAETFHGLGISYYVITHPPSLLYPCG